jgi:acetoacetate decarboxylase
MGFVKTREEIEQIEDKLSAPRWRGEWLAIQFLTDPATVERLLPPPLQPAPEALATATVGRWQSNCLGDFCGGVLSLAACYDGVDGSYPLVIYMDREPALVFGREVFGEPKKEASSRLFKDRGEIHGWIERHGVRLVELRASVGDDLGPDRGERFSFNYKARTEASGRGLQEDAVLTRTQFAVDIRSQRVGAGSVALAAGPHDPLDEVPVFEIRRAIYAEDESAARCRAVAVVSANDFLPYHYGRQDDWLVLDTAAPVEQPMA